MEVKWTLERKQLVGIMLYAAILPASLLAMPFLGDWLLMIGTLISLPLAPFGFVAFWFFVTAGGKALAFFATWLVNFFVAWLLVVQYIGHKKRNKIKTGALKHIAVSIVAAIVFIIVVTAALKLL